MTLRLDKLRRWVLGARVWILGTLAVLVVLIVLLLPETWWGVAAGRGFGRLETVAKILTPLVLLVGVGAALWRIRVAEEGQITERFTRAVEHLGRSGGENLPPGRGFTGREA